MINIEVTKNAIEREERKISNIEAVNEIIPKEILDLVESGVLKQWTKHPETFFVDGVEKARIVWDKKKKVVCHRYISELKDVEQRKKFASIYNNLNELLNKK